MLKYNYKEQRKKLIIMIKKALIFDMDGTLCDFYGVDGWLDDLHHFNTRPYEVAEPMYNMSLLKHILMALKEVGYKVIITSWLAKDSTKEYDDAVRQAKKSWLNKYDFPYDEIHLVKYGRTKGDCTRSQGGFQILIDDNENVRKGWHLGSTIDANYNIINELIKLLNAELK